MLCVIATEVGIHMDWTGPNISNDQAVIRKS